MHEHRKTPHDKLQRRVLIGAIIFALIAAAVAVPLVTNEDLRYDLAMRFGQIPGQSVEKLADGDDEALLIVLPLDNDEDADVTPWLFRAQFVAWPSDDGIDLQNLESGEHIALPIERVEFIAANGDGTLVLVRGHHAISEEPVALTVEPSTMNVEELESFEATPDDSGEWEESIWDKRESWCNRPSPGKRFVACFAPSDLASYAAGDWELRVQLWGDYTEQYPVFRGQGFLPFVGFAHDDTVMYFQNERGIWRAEIPEDILIMAPVSTPYATPRP